VIEGARAIPPQLAELSRADWGILEPYLTTVRFPAGTCIFRVGSAGDASYVIDDGIVRIDIEREHMAHEVDTESTLGYVEPGGLLGELSLLDGQPRSASAFAQTDVVALRIGADAVTRLAHEQPRVAVALYAALGRDAAIKLRETNLRLANAIFPRGRDPDSDDVDAMVARAHAAQEAFESWPEERVDRLLLAIATAVHDAALDLARASVAETGIGLVASKVLKNRATSLGVFRLFLEGKRGRGPIGDDPARRVTEIASPVGVVLGLGPVTNPVSTFTFKTLICLKSRNALILSPNRSAQGVTARVGGMIREQLERAGAPLDLVQFVATRTSRKKTLLFMAHDGISLILATGGASMVKAAYSSGRPAIGVGPGNAPVLVAASADPRRVVSDIVLSKTFDNGLPCGGEHNLVVVSRARDAFVAECERQGVAVLSEPEAAAFEREAVSPATRRLKPELVGQSAASIADRTGIRRSGTIQLIVVPTRNADMENPWAHEKMAPVLSLFTVENEERGLDLCQALLGIDGCGHTAVIHTDDEALIQRFAERMPASRILVNSPSVHGTLGICTGLALSSTLGCGTFGGTSTTDNVGWRHLVNVKRLARRLPEAQAAWAPLLA
jgi:acyl-CoA reductase-like NAD-dependent aldehyde dehydrogenase